LIKTLTIFSNDESNLTQKETATNSSSQIKLQKKVTWKKKIVEGREADSDDSDDTAPLCTTVRFQHTPSVLLWF